MACCHRPLGGDDEPPVEAQFPEMNELWALFVDEVRKRNKDDVDPKNFLGSVAAHKAAFDKAVLRLKAKTYHSGRQ